MRFGSAKKIQVSSDNSEDVGGTERHHCAAELVKCTIDKRSHDIERGSNKFTVAIGVLEKFQHLGYRHVDVVDKLEYVGHRILILWSSDVLGEPVGKKGYFLCDNEGVS